MEPLLRSELKRTLLRGRVEGTLSLDHAAHPGAEAPVPAFNQPALRAYLASFHAMAKEHNLACQPDLNTAALLPGLLLSVAPNPVSKTALSEALPTLLDQALSALLSMRAHEGEALRSVMEHCLAHLAGLTGTIATRREGARQTHFAHLTARLRALLEAETDANRLLTEAALLAERGDIEEELARMHTHIAHFRAIVSTGGEAGKRLDFLLQEMNREANTILSKTAGTTGGAVEITEAALAMKSEIEKLREQVQNIE